MLKFEDLTDTQKKAYNKLTDAEKKAYLFAADVQKCASLRIIAADLVPLEALETIDNGVVRSVLKLKRKS